jgi:hypothetical protein
MLPGGTEANHVKTQDRISCLRAVHLGDVDYKDQEMNEIFE